MRFTLLCASTALAASLMLAACSGGAGSSSAIPGGASATAPMAHHGYHLVSVGRNKPQSCNSPYFECYLVSPGSDEQFGWCISYSGNCSSGVLTDKIKWNNISPCGTGAQTYDQAKAKCDGRVKSVWGPPKAVVGVQEESVPVKASVPYGDGSPTFNVTWTACSVKGTYKGSCFGDYDIGIIVGPY